MINGVKPGTLSPAQLQRLGLDAAPFDTIPTDGRPFSDDAIDTQVNVALHILQHTDQVLLVHGEPGLGKTAFLELLRRAAGDELLLVCLTPGVNDPSRAVYRTIAEAGGIDGEDESTAVSALLRLWEMGQRPVLLLDDADHISREVVEALLHIHTTLGRRQTTPGLVLAASRDLVPTISSAAGEEGLSPHVVNLHALDEDQTRQYVRERLRQAGSMDGRQLSDSQCRQIHHRTGGNPANINREATRLLAAAVSAPGGGGGAKPNRWLLPTVIGAVVVLLGGLIAATYLVEEQTERNSPAAAASADGERAEKPLALPSRKNLEEKIRGSRQDTARGEAKPHRTGSAATRALQGDQPQVSASGQGGVQAAPESAPTTPPAEETAQAKETTRAAQQPKQPAPSPEQADPATQQPAADHYTIQLIGAYDRENLEGFVKALSLDGQTRIITTRRKDRNWHVVVYGDYASREAAGQGLQRLPTAAREHGPWVRSFGSLQ